jgi:hypothetical protein
MKTIHVLIACMLSAFAYAQKIEYSEALIEGIEKKRQDVDSYISEYTFLSKKGELHAVIGRVANRQLLTKITIKATGDIFADIWSADGKRVFMKMDGKTVCVNDVYLVFNSIFALESAFSGEFLNHRVENYIHLEKESLVCGLLSSNNSSGVFREIKSDPSTKIEKINDGLLRFTNDEVGTVVIDPSDASIIEQDNQSRTMKRIRHETKNAVHEINQILSKIEPGPFEVIPLDKAFPYVRAMACITCQNILSRIEKEELSLRVMKDNLEKDEKKLSEVVIPVLIKGKKHILSNERVDALRDYVTAGLEKHMRENGIKPEEIKSYFESEKADKTLEDSMINATTKVVNDAGQKAIDRIIHIVLDGDLSAKTDVGLQAKKVMSDALVRNYIKATVQDSLARYKRNRTLD